METTALPGSAAAQALPPGKTEPAAAPVVVDSPSGTQGARGEFDLDAELAAYKDRILNPPPPEKTVEPEALVAPETPVETEEEDADAEPDEPADLVSGKPPAKNYRETARSDFEAEVFQLRRRNRDMSLKEAMERVEAKHGKPAETVPAAVTPPLEAGATALEARKAEIKAALKQAVDDFDLEKQVDLQSELAELPFQIFEARQKELAAQTARQSEVNAVISGFEAKAIALYPEIEDANSDMFREMADIAAALEDAGDPLCEKPDFGLRVAQMAAAKLNIAPETAPKSNSQTPSASEPKAPKTVRPRPMMGNGATPQAAPPVDVSKMSIDDLAAARERHLRSIGQSPY